MLPGPAVPGCCLVSVHFLWAILSTSTVLCDLQCIVKIKQKISFQFSCSRWSSPSGRGSASTTRTTTRTTTAATTTAPTTTAPTKTTTCWHWSSKETWNQRGHGTQGELLLPLPECSPTRPTEPSAKLELYRVVQLNFTPEIEVFCMLYFVCFVSLRNHKQGWMNECLRILLSCFKA